MEAKAIQKYARLTPRKAKRVMDLIKGKRAGDTAVLIAAFIVKSLPLNAVRWGVILVVVYTHQHVADGGRRAEAQDDDGGDVGVTAPPCEA